MADDHADSAVINRVHYVHAECRGLENSGGKDNFIPQRVVVGVGSRRSHAPAPAINRLADGSEAVVKVEFLAGQRILPVRIAADFYFAVVLPFVGVADFWIEGGEFFQS